jgi:hypothetical protein
LELPRTCSLPSGVEGVVDTNGSLLPDGWTWARGRDRWMTLRTRYFGCASAGLEAKERHERRRMKQAGRV